MIEIYVNYDNKELIKKCGCKWINEEKKKGWFMPLSIDEENLNKLIDYNDQKIIRFIKKRVPSWSPLFTGGDSDISESLDDIKERMGEEKYNKLVEKNNRHKIEHEASIRLDNINYLVYSKAEILELYKINSDLISDEYNRRRKEYKKINRQKGIAIIEKKPIFLNSTKTEDNKYYAYQGGYYTYITEDKYKDIRTLTTDYMPIFIDKHDMVINKNYDKNDNKSTKWINKELKQLYDEFIKDADILKKETNGLINMYKSGRNVKTAVELAYNFLNKNEIYSDKITLKESEWIENASMGPMLFADKYEGEAWKYDINSAYPSIYSNNNFLIPVKQGTFKKINSDEFLKKGFVSYGIYRCVIEYNDNNKDNSKIFKLNSANFYTSIEINYAVKLGFKVTLIEDDKDNFLEYLRINCKTGHECFNEYVKLLYPLRQNNNIKERVKSLLNCLWGALTQKNIFTKIYDPDVECELEGDCEIIEMVPYNETLYKIVYMKRNQPYETNWARIKPFILAKARIKISEFIRPYKEHIKRCHTDSMTSDIKLDIKHSLELGKMKLEKTGHCVIKNVMNETWE